VYRRADDRRLVYLRVVDERRPGIVIRIRIFDVDTWDLLRDDDAREEPRIADRPRDDRPRQERPRDERPPENRPPVVQPPPPARDTVRPPQQRPPLPPIEIIRPVQPQPRDTARPPEQRPPEQRPPEQRPPEQRPPEQRPPEQRPPEQRPPDQPPPPVAALTLDIPPGHLPEIGECRVWVEGVPPGQQAKPKSRSCDGITSVAPAGSWIVYRPGNDRTVVHVRLVDARRPGVVIRIRIFDIDTRRLLREETP
jgi:hypothetical protein